MHAYKKWLLFLVATIGAYGASLQYGFSQDDYYFLLISRAQNSVDVLNFFNPWSQHGFAFYRPLGTQLYFYVATLIGGLERAPFLMHAFMLIVQSCNAYLAYALVKKLTKGNALAIWVGVLYAVSAAHFLSLFYIAATQQLLAALFGLLSLNAFLEKKLWLSAAMFFLALLCKENAMTVPVIAMLLWQFHVHDAYMNVRDWIKKVWSEFLPYGIVGIIYIGMRLAAGIHVQSEYQPVIGPSLISTLRWYFLFAYGAPEELIRYAIPGLFINFWRFIRDHGALAIVSTITSVTVSLYAIAVLIRSVVAKKPFKYKKLVLYVLWWLSSIVLVVWFPEHRYPHYLDLGLIPLLLIVMESATGKWRHVVGILLVLSSYAGIMISIYTHWTVKRAEIAERTVERIASLKVCEGDSILFTGEGNQPLELSYVLSLSNGPRVICNNPDLDIYYGEAPSTVKEYGIVPIQGLLP